MSTETVAQQLHEKATQGDTLTDAEQARLEAWYERQDAVENGLLTSSAQQAANSVRSPPT